VTTGQTEYHVVAYIPMGGIEGPGFALPVFADPNNHNLRLVQEVDEYTALVAAFRLLQGGSNEGIRLANGPVAKIGGELIYIFVSEDGNAHAGRLKEIEPALRTFALKCPERIAIGLQIAELVGNTEERRAARGAMARAVMSKSGVDTARALYERSTLNAALWGKLISSAVDANAARRIAGVRSKLIATLDHRGRISLDLQALDARDNVRIDQDRLKLELEREFEHMELRPESIPTKIAPRPSKVAEDVVQEALVRLSRTGRQEERIALLLDYVFRYPAASVDIMGSYSSDRAAYARSLIPEIRQMVVDAAPTFRVDKAKVVERVRRRFARGMPTSRAFLLVYLSKYLGKYPEVNALLRKHVPNKMTLAGAYRNTIRKNLGLEEPDGVSRK